MKIAQRLFATVLCVAILFAFFCVPQPAAAAPDSSVAIPTAYADILDMFYRNLSNGWAEQDGENYEDPCDPDSVCYLLSQYSSNYLLSEMGYALRDLNADGQPELIISSFGLADSGGILDFYTLQNNQPVQLGSGGERYHYVLAESNAIYFYGSGGAAVSSTEILRLDSAGELELEEAIIYDGYLDEDSPWFYADSEYSDDYGYFPGALTAVTETEADTILTGFPQPVELELIPFTTYTPVHQTELLTAVQSLLVGIRYSSSEINVARWSDADVVNFIYSKLNWDFLGSLVFLEGLGLDTPSFNGEESYFSYDAIQKLTQSALGRDFPTETYANHLYVSGNQVMYSPAAGECEIMTVQACQQQGDTVVAVGTSAWAGSASGEYQGCFRAVLKENPDSIYGYTLVSVTPIQENQSFRGLQASASSELKESTRTHFARNVLDGDLTTVWCEGVDGVGVGEWIYLETSDGSDMEISMISFSAGHHKSDDHLAKNGWPSSFLIEGANGFSQTVELYDYIDLVTMDSSFRSSWIKITILSADAGYKYEDTCISEIKLHGVDTDACFRQYWEDNPVVEEPVIDPTPEPKPEPQPGEQPENQPETPTTTSPGSNQSAAIYQPIHQVVESDGNEQLLIWVIIGATVVVVAAATAVIIVVLKKKKQ